MNRMKRRKTSGFELVTSVVEGADGEGNRRKKGDGFK
jgi:hypothetical protein